MNSSAEVAANLACAEALLAEAAARGARLAVLPENFAFMGQHMQQQRELAESLGAGPIQDQLCRWARHYRLWIVAGTLPLRIEGSDKLHAACLVYNELGECVAQYDKIHLFDVEVPEQDECYRESAVFSPGRETVVIDSPVGKLGLAVCYDLRFPELFRRLQAQGAEVLVLPAAFTEATGAAHWHTLLRARAIENLCHVAAAAQTGQHASGRHTYGHSIIYSPWGDTLAKLHTASGIAIAELDLPRQQHIRMQFPALQHRKL